MSTPMLALAATSSHISSIFPIALVVFGVILFIVGFMKYREYRVLADTPRVSIRSAPMGLVHVSGTSTGGEPLASPLTQVACYYYEVRVEKKVKKDDKEEWEETHREKAEVPFYLQDDTGKVLVNPQQAEYNLPRSFWGELRPPALLSFGHAPRKVDESLGVPPPTDEHLRAYLNGQFSQARAAVQASNIPGAKMMDKGLAIAQKMQALGVSIGGGGISMDFGNHEYRFTETCLVAGRPTHVLGTCTENPNPADEGDRNLIRKGQNEKTCLISTKSEEKLEGSLRLQSILLILIGAVMIVGGAALGLHSAHML
ncbi:MAG TPA: GIDE domain-containing protein [Terriglobia bacterium]|nr:GIDE domain-containing protein [Terriglobia bacterium]